MNTQHTPEPWTAKKMHISAGDENLGYFYGNCTSKKTDYANAQRIVSCVNACAGMVDPAREIAELRAEIARLKTPPSAPTCDEVDFDSRS